MKHISENWDEQHGIATCFINSKTSSGIILTGVGIAECGPEDLDMMSERTGTVIAEYRAEIDLLKKINNFEIKPGIMALKHVYCTMLHSKQYNPNSYEAKRIKKELAHLLDELEENKMMIKEQQQHLNIYIQQKDEIYQKIRKARIK